MIVTEKKIIGLLGYTSSQIRRRRQLHWTEGRHYWKEPGGATCYNTEEIAQWMASTKKEEGAESFGAREGAGSRSHFRSHTHQLV